MNTDELITHHDASGVTRVYRVVPLEAIQPQHDERIYRPRPKKEAKKPEPEAVPVVDTEPPRFCEFCGKQLARKPHEILHDYRKRRFCGRDCSHHGQRARVKPPKKVFISAATLERMKKADKIANYFTGKALANTFRNIRRDG